MIYDVLKIKMINDNRAAIFHVLIFVPDIVLRVVLQLVIHIDSFWHQPILV